MVQIIQKITTFLWFNDQAKEAVKFYATLFKNSKISTTLRYDEAGAKASGRAKGSVMTIAFQLENQEFTALNGGPIFTFTPAISFFVSCDTEQEVDALYKKLSAGGQPLMPLDTYPWSKRYGWINDKYAVSWQIMLAEANQKIIPCLMFVGKQHGKAEEAINHYVSVFKNSAVKMIARYEKGEDTPGTIKHAKFSLGEQGFIAMDSGLPHQFTFTEATSFVVNCETQEEIDHFWKKLSADPKSEQCGWLKDKFSVSWQIVPRVLEKMLGDKDVKKAQQAMKAMLQMKKIDIKKLQQAYDNTQ